MRVTRQRFCVRLFAILVLATAWSVAARAAEEGWVSLFNGKDLQGWVPVHDVTFQVVDGNLRLVKGMGWLRTEKTYADFVLELEWRALEPKYDSGIFFRSGTEGKPWPDGGWQVNLRFDALCGLVKGYSPVVPSETPRLPVDQWVKVRLEVKGTKAKLWVNGEEAWETDKIDRKTGHLGFQAEDKSFDFRNIRVRELP